MLLAPRPLVPRVLLSSGSPTEKASTVSATSFMALQLIAQGLLAATSLMLLFCRQSLLIHSASYISADFITGFFRMLFDFAWCIYVYIHIQNGTAWICPTATALCSEIHVVTSAFAALVTLQSWPGNSFLHHVWWSCFRCLMHYLRASHPSSCSDIALVCLSNSNIPTHLFDFLGDVVKLGHFLFHIFQVAFVSFFLY